MQQQGYRIEKILYASRPGCLVTGHLYIPDKLTGPAPSVIGTCGHSDNGKNDELYQAFCQRLARAGFVVLIYDPFNQGERDQYWKLSDKSAVANCCHAHNMMGKQLELVGEWFGAWRAWDGIRALDYLLSRPEVDPAHVGLTGNSGGGTMTTWLWAIENRFTMAAPSCFVTTFLSNLENELPADCEQYPPGVIGAGLELADFCIARAPEPVLLLGQNYDFFDRRGLREAHEEVRRFYDLLGASQEDAQLFIGPEGHGFSRHNQEAMVDFFARQAGLPQSRKIHRPAVLTADQLNVTPRGNTVEAGAVPIYDLTAAAACRLEQKRTKLDKARLAQRLTVRLQLPRKRPLPHYRVLRPAHLDGQTIARYGVETEDGIQALLHKCLADPPRPYSLDVEGEVHLYLPHVAAEDDLQGDALAIALRRQHSLYALDVRGLGESIPTPAEAAFFHPYGMDYMFHGHGLMLGQSYLGRRLHDVLSTLDLLVAAGARRVRLYGRGQGALLALYAALLHDNDRLGNPEKRPAFLPRVDSDAAGGMAGCLFHPRRAGRFRLARLPARLGQQSSFSTAVEPRHAARTESPSACPTERTGADQDTSGQSLTAHCDGRLYPSRSTEPFRSPRRQSGGYALYPFLVQKLGGCRWRSADCD